MTAGKWPMCACPSTQPHFPIHATTHKAGGAEKTAIAMANVWTMTQTAVVHTATVIMMVMQQICTDY